VANEITARVSLTVRNGNLTYQTQPTGFSADQRVAKGPSPGAITVTTAGTDVSFAQLSQPAWCRLMNLDPTNFVQWGVYDVANGLFHPVGVLRPGQMALFELSPNLGEEYTGAGTGTTAPLTTFRVKADTASCVVLVEAFDQ
jgi:hypothetical protein